MTETQQKILDTAERLFAENGYGATSLRQIIAEAGVNLAAIHYHFGSKEDLLDKLIMRKAGPVNEERIAKLNQAEAEAGQSAPPIDKVLEAFLGPPVQRINQSPQFVKLMGRMYGEGLMPVIAEKHFHPLIERFFAAMQRSLPELDDRHLRLRLQFMVGTMAHAMFACSTAIPVAGAPPTVDPPALLREMVAFLSAGLRAPVVSPVCEETMK